MAQPPDLQRLPLDDLARGCAQESERFRLRLEQDARFCFEIFRRAIADADGQASLNAAKALTTWWRTS